MTSAVVVALIVGSGGLVHAAKEELGTAREAEAMVDRGVARVMAATSERTMS
jgi:hypothetical protein